MQVRTFCKASLIRSDARQPGLAPGSLPCWPPHCPHKPTETPEQWAGVWAPAHNSVAGQPQSDTLSDQHIPLEQFSFLQFLLPQGWC